MAEAGSQGRRAWKAERCILRIVSVRHESEHLTKQASHSFGTAFKTGMLAVRGLSGPSIAFRLAARDPKPKLKFHELLTSLCRAAA